MTPGGRTGQLAGMSQKISAPFWAAVGVASAMAFGGILLVVATNSKPAAQRIGHQDVPDAGLVTWSKYEQIRPGMTYAEVVEILGKDGVEQGRTGTGSISIHYTWGNTNGTGMAAHFNDGKLSTKSQFGLK